MPKKGYIPSEEHREKLSLSQKGKVITEEHRNRLIESHSTDEYRKKFNEVTKGKPHPHKGRTYTEQDRINMRLSKINKLKGSDNPNWKGGIPQIAHIKRRVLAEGVFTYGEWETLKEQYGFKCPCCGRKEPVIKLTVDHIIPIVKGGSNYITNIQPLCILCNKKKFTKVIKFDPEIMEPNNAEM